MTHGIVGGVRQEMMGGNFSHGFWAASFADASAPFGESTFNGDNWTGVAGRVTVAAVVGGTASEIGGGKFANGAVTGTFVQAFNYEMHRVRGDALDRAVGEGQLSVEEASAAQNPCYGEGAACVAGGLAEAATAVPVGGAAARGAGWLAGESAKGLRATGRHLFGKGGALNRGPNLRIGIGRSGGESVFRIAGSYLGKVPGPIRNFVGIKQISPGQYKWDLWRRGAL